MGKKFYYVSVIDGTKRGMAAGPYATHEEALDRVNDVRMACELKDPRAWFWAFGTAGADVEYKTAFGVV